jgi:hypothetical protein
VTLLSSDCEKNDIIKDYFLVFLTLLEVAEINFGDSGFLPQK